MKSVPNDFIEDIKRIVDSILNQREDLNIRWLHGVEKINDIVWPGGAGISDHDLLNNLGWAAAGHTIDADILPVTDSAHNLGSATHAFAALYCDKLTGYVADILLEKHLLPTTDSSHNLGSATYAFSTLFVDTLDGGTGNEYITMNKALDMNTHKINNVTSLYLGTLYSTGTEIHLDDHLIPLGDSVVNLGSAAYAYANLYCDTLTGKDADISLAKNLVPTTDSAHNLGSATHAFAALYCDKLTGYVADILLEKHLLPTTDSSHNLGSATYAFSTLFVDTLDGGTGNEYITMNKALDMNTHKINNVTSLYLGTLYSTGTEIHLDDHLIPLGDSVVNLGSATYAFNDLYADRILGGAENDDAALDLDFRGDANHRIRYNGTAANELEYKTYLRHRFMIQAAEVLNIDADELAMETGMKVGLNSIGGGTYLKDDASGNMELHVATGKKIKIVVG